MACGAAAAPPEPAAELADRLPAAAAIEADQQTTESALRLMQDATVAQLDGRHHTLLRALRHRRDATLRPLFAGLAEQGRHPSLRVHGLLGLAETSPRATLDYAAVAGIADPEVRRELISAALDGDLLKAALIEQLLAWPQLEPGVKLLLALPRVAAGGVDAEAEDMSVLRDLLNSPVPGQRYLAALLLKEAGYAPADERLAELLEPENAADPALVGMLLETSWDHGLAGTADWAAAVSSEASLPARVRLLGLKLAIRFGVPGAEADWAREMAEAEEPSGRLRLAMAGLAVAPWLSPTLPQIAAEGDPIIGGLREATRQIAARRAGEAGNAEVVAAVEQLLELHYAPAWRWVADYARQTASVELAAVLIATYQVGDPRGRSRRLEAVASATQTLIEVEPETAVKLLSATLSADTASRSARRAVMLGLIRSRHPAAQEVLRRLPAEGDRPGRALRLVLQMQEPRPLSEEEAGDLLWLLDGGGGVDDTLRVQTAWAYLVATGQGTAATEALLAPPLPGPNAEDR